MHSVVAHTLYRTEAIKWAAQDIGEFATASDEASDWSEGWTDSAESLPSFSLKCLNYFPSASNPTKLLISNNISPFLISLFTLIEVTSRPLQIKDPNCSIPSLRVSLILILWLHWMWGLSVHICYFSLFNLFFASFSSFCLGFCSFRIFVSLVYLFFYFSLYFTRNPNICNGRCFLENLHKLSKCSTCYRLLLSSLNFICPSSSKLLTTFLEIKMLSLLYLSACVHYLNCYRYLGKEIMESMNYIWEKLYGEFLTWYVR